MRALVMRRLAIVSLLMLIAGPVSLLLLSSRPEAVYQQRTARHWVQDLASPSYQVQTKAEQALAALGPDALPALIDALKERPGIFSRWRRNIAEKFTATPAGPTIDYVSLRQNAARQLARQPPAKTGDTPVKALVGALGDEEMAVRAEAQHALRSLGLKALPALMHGTRHGDAKTRCGAVEVIAALSPAGTNMLRALLSACTDRDATVRATAARALGAVASEGAESVHALHKALADQSSEVRVAAADSLAKVNTATFRNDTMARLELSLTDPAPSVRIAAARTYWLLSGSTVQALPVLVAAVPDENVGWKVPFILAEMGPEAAKAVPTLVEKLKNEIVPRPLRSPPIAAQALGRIGLPSVGALRKLLKDPRGRVRTGAILALGLVGPPARQAVDDLAIALHDPELEVRQASALSLGIIAPENKLIVPALKEMIRDDDVFLSSTAATMLRRVLPEDETGSGN